VTQAPPFFVPAATPEGQEFVFVELARLAAQAVPQPSERIYSITYDHDGEEWTATVGESLRGVRRNRRRSKGSLDREIPLADAALVLAIFPGTPYVVVTDSRPVGRVRSENPFIAGVPKSVTRFSTP
jgi:hypothetical protein